MITCVNDGEYELEIKRSRFIAVSRHIDTRNDVKAVVDELRRQHPDARHVCYGFIADEKGDDFGYDDDGEPSGTAGKPIYSALAASGARKTAIAVVRYFGGVKLGAGGLTRAYRESAAQLIENAGIRTVERYAVYGVTCGGDVYKKAMSVLRASDCSVENIVFNADARFTVTAPVSFDLEHALSAIGVKPQKISEKYM